jgi:hypothetical protein
LFSKNLEQIPKISRIGDIIYLKRYNFDFYTDEIKATPHQPLSPGYYIFDGDPETTNFEVLDSDSV